MTVFAGTVSGCRLSSEYSQYTAMFKLVSSEARCIATAALAVVVSPPAGRLLEDNIVGVRT